MADKNNFRGWKFVKTSDNYKYVSIMQSNLDKSLIYLARIKTKNGYNCKRFLNERDAALAVDKALIHLNIVPVNILKLKKIQSNK